MLKKLFISMAVFFLVLSITGCSDSKELALNDSTRIEFEYTNGFGKERIINFIATLSTETLHGLPVTTLHVKNVGKRDVYFARNSSIVMTKNGDTVASSPILVELHPGEEGTWSLQSLFPKNNLSLADTIEFNHGSKTAFTISTSDIK